MKYLRWIVPLLIVGGLIVVSLLPKPVPVDIANVSRSNMVVAVEVEGVTRVRDLFLVAASVSGRVKRIELKEGDQVSEGSPITTIYPAQMNPAQRSELEAQISSIEASQQSTEANVEGLKNQLTQARKEEERLKNLLDAGAIAEQQYEQAELAVKTLADQLESARYAVRSTAKQVEAAKSGRAAYGSNTAGINVVAPASGSVLRVFEESERVVMAGTPLIAIGNPKGLEIVVDVLSTDAVKIEPGDRILIDGWGGDKQLEGIVRYIEPSAFTKISALGIEEQRVNIIGMFSEYPDKLGDGYRVIARIVTWEGADVLQVPSSALFRDGESWGVFVVEDGTAHKRTVTIGHRNAFDVEVIEGLSEGDQVILHPSNQIEDGVGVEGR
ncbi:MAG: efflux RND transporter periplasmic adaptor subunit [Ignavibacteriae bacterium]|nr:efflux RND transporter periplasmic adaptor subunit [Ignavibacteriota bacterium]MCB9214901.1 efflux RND transporter periplasmic adaptor subunit [Ignavibacteria bacterium]